MDPNFFRVDLDRAFEVFVAIMLLALIIERTLAMLFEHEWYIKKLDGKGLKPVIAFAVSLIVCRYWEFDAVSVIILAERTTWLGYLLTAGVIAGGSKASIKLFHDFLDIKSSAERERGGDKDKPPVDPT